MYIQNDNRGEIKRSLDNFNFKFIYNTIENKLHLISRQRLLLPYLSPIKPGE